LQKALDSQDGNMTLDPLNLLSGKETSATRKKRKIKFSYLVEIHGMETTLPLWLGYNVESITLIKHGKYDVD